MLTDYKGVVMDLLVGEETLVVVDARLKRVAGKVERKKRKGRMKVIKI